MSQAVAVRLSKMLSPALLASLLFFEQPRLAMQAVLGMSHSRQRPRTCRENVCWVLVCHSLNLLRSLNSTVKMQDCMRQSRTSNIPGVVRALTRKGFMTKLLRHCPATF